MLWPPKQTPHVPAFAWLQAVSLVECCGLIALLLHASNRQRSSSMAGLLRIAALACLASLSIFAAAGCGSANAVPQSTPASHVIGTPQGASTLTPTPPLTTSTGTPLPRIPPIQLPPTV